MLQLGNLVAESSESGDYFVKDPVVGANELEDSSLLLCNALIRVMEKSEETILLSKSRMFIKMRKVHRV